MVRNLTSLAAMKLWSFFLALVQPRYEVLAPYSRQWMPLRGKLLSLIGLAILLGIGMMYGFYAAVLPPNMRVYLLAPIAIMLLLVIWTLPDQVNPPTRLMIRCFFLFVAISVVWPDYIAISIPGMPWISMRRLVLAPMALCLLISLSVSKPFRGEMRDALGIYPPLPKMMVGFLIIQAASLSMAVMGDITVSVKNYINYQFLRTAVFFVSAYTLRSEESILRLIKIFFITAVVVAVIGIIESREQQVLWMDHIPSFLQVDPKMLDQIYGTRFRDGLYRTKSTFTNPLPFAEFLALSSPILLFYIIRTKSIFLIAGLILLDIIFLYAILSTQARLGNLGFLVSHAIFGLLWGLRRWKTSRFSLIGPAMSLAYPGFLIALCLAIMTVSSINNRVLGSSSTQGSDNARREQVAKGLPIIAKSPIFGYGPGRAAGVLGFKNYTFVTIDSYMLSIGLDYGAVGFILFYGMFLLTIYWCFRLLMMEEGLASDLPLLIVSMMSAFILIKSVLSQEDNNSIPFILMGAALGLLNMYKKRHGALPTAAWPS